MIGNSYYLSAFHRPNNLLSSMKHSFFLGDYTNSRGENHLYLNLYALNKREKIKCDIWIPKKDWDQKKQIIKNPQLKDLNLLINEIKAQINKIEIQFRLSGQILTVEKCAHLLKRPDLNVDFIAFMEHEMKMKIMEPNSRKNHESVLKKLKEWKSSLLFPDVNDNFIQKYRHYLFHKKKNQEVTIDSNIKVIKSYIKLAKKRGHIINIDLDEIKIKQHRSHRTNLNLEELERMKEYYFSSFIKPAHKKTLGYFLFNCMTGLRINDLLKIERQNLNDDYFNFWNQKGKKQQVLLTNETCKKILAYDPTLFQDKITPKTINETIKEICNNVLGIQKHVSCHVARHTFATNYLRKGGKVEDLQILLGHSEIKTTMVYVHIVESDVIKTMSILD